METSIIIYTYNEERTIFNFVASCCKYKPESEIIVVDDGSNDCTLEVLETLSIHHSFVYLKLDENKGKNYAMVHGAEYATNEILLFVDVNGPGLQKADFEKLLKPIEMREADIVIGTLSNILLDFGKNPYQEFIVHKALLKSDIEPLFIDIREVAFDVEFFIMLYYQLSGKRMRLVHFEGKTDSINGATVINNRGKELKEKKNEMALAFLANIELITKRLQNTLFKTENYTRSTITSVQFDLNSKMKRLKDGICSA